VYVCVCVCQSSEPLEDSSRRGIGGLLAFTGGIVPSPTLVRPYPTVSSPPVGRPPPSSAFPGPPDNGQASARPHGLLNGPPDSGQSSVRPHGLLNGPPDSGQGSVGPPGLLTGPPDNGQTSVKLLGLVPGPSDSGQTSAGPPAMLTGIPDGGQASVNFPELVPGPPDSGQGSARPPGLLMSDVCETMARIRSSLLSAGASHFDSLLVTLVCTLNSVHVTPHLILSEARYCYHMSSVRLSVRLSVTLVDHDHIG